MSLPMVLAAINVEPSEFLAVVGTSAVAVTLGDRPVESPHTIEVPRLVGGTT